jgi:hypothetical protein
LLKRIPGEFGPKKYIGKNEDKRKLKK